MFQLSSHSGRRDNRLRTSSRSINFYADGIVALADGNLRVLPFDMPRAVIYAKLAGHLVLNVFKAARQVVRVHSLRPDTRQAHRTGQADRNVANVQPFLPYCPLLLLLAFTLCSPVFALVGLANDPHRYSERKLGVLNWRNRLRYQCVNVYRFALHLFPFL
jgi:hypothetical protein